MNQKMMKDKIAQLEDMIAEIQRSLEKAEIPIEDGERDYKGPNRLQMTTTVPDWIVDHCREKMLPDLNDKIQAFHYNKLTTSDLIRQLIYGFMLYPDDALFATYDEIKHLKDN